MKRLKQFGIILMISFIGEVLHEIVPLPVPASIYGIVILFLSLEFNIIRVSAVKEASNFLIEIMPVMFIPAAAGLINSWELIRSAWVSYLVITAVSTVLVMVTAGKAVQFVMKLPEKNGKKG